MCVWIYTATITDFMTLIDLEVSGDWQIEVMLFKLINSLLMMNIISLCDYNNTN